MATTRYPEDRYLLDEKSRAEFAALSVLKNAVAGPPEFEAWLAGTVRKQPLTIHDINGAPLFHDYPVARGKELLGHVRVAASQLIGNAAVATELGPRGWDLEVARKKIAPKVKRDFPKAKIAAPKLVCYSYPKLGLMFEVVEASGAKAQAIYDVSSYTRVPMKPERPGAEGFHAWSFYGSLSDDDRKKRLARFKKVEAERTAVPDKLRRDMLAARTLLSVYDRFTAVLVYRRQVTKLLQYCNHYGHTHARSHHCFVLHGQQVNDYCAVATCQMILCYYRHYHTQDQIAPSLGYSGGCPPDTSAGYESLTCNHLNATFDSSPTWEKGRDQIDLLRPFKSGVPGHARAVAGYSYVRWGFALGLEEKKLYVYDPWPWNADYALGGAVTWEDWDSITHTNYLYARIDCP